MTINSSRSKRKITSQSTYSISKKLRSDLPRRRRSLFSPIVLPNNNDPPIDRPNPASQSISVSLIACDEVSCNTTTDSVAGAGNRNDEFRRVTRLYSKQKEIERAKWMMIGAEAEVSETSCVESSSIADAESKLQSKSNGVAKVSGVLAVAVAPNSASTIEQSNAKRSDVDSILLCSESLSDDEDGLEFTSSATFSERQSEPLSDESEIDIFSDTSIWTDCSGSQFSLAGDSSPSPFVSLYKQYSKQLIRSSSNSCNGVQSSCIDEFADGFTYWRFEDEEDEQSYELLRSRERKQSLKLDDYVTKYASTSEYGVPIHEQRLQMVGWIIETSDTKDLREETLFLAVRLLDRFLSKGFFKNRQYMEIVGIACLTLATRIEEKQPYNCILQQIFHVNKTVYGRTEVVAMERLIQEELKFQCFSPTTYNFLWFYLKAAAADGEMESRAEQLAELAMFDHAQLQFWPSSLAAGIVMLVSLVAKQDESCLRVMKAHLRASFDDLPECIKSLEWLVKYAS